MKKGIIVASFGTTHGDTCKLCIENIENRIKEEYKDYLVLRAFTSQMVINRLKKRDDIHVLNLKEAIEEMKSQGIEEVYIQSLHIMAGHEYEKLNKYGIPVGLPLLSLPEDYESIIEDTSIKDLGNNDALVFMGHGSNHESDRVYEILEKGYHSKGFNNIFIGTVEGEKTIDHILEKLKVMDYKKIKLKPFMLVAGDHAKNDMASRDEDSWKSILEREGYEVETCLKGLGEYKVVEDIFLQHLKKLIGK